MPPATRLAAVSVNFKCAHCANVPSQTEPNLISCGGCRGPRYCNRTCQKADKKNHKADCKTLQLLAQPIHMAKAHDFIKLRTKESAELAKSPDTIYHLQMIAPREPKQVKYLGPFVELDGLKHSIREAMDDLCTVIPSGGFLGGLLDSPSCGLAGVEELRVPMEGFNGVACFQIGLEKNAYITYCVRNLTWTLQKLLYAVVVETPKFHYYDEKESTKDKDKDKSKGKGKVKKKGKGKARKRGRQLRRLVQQYTASVDVKATFASLAAAQALVATMKQAWIKRYSASRVVMEEDGPYLTRWVQYTEDWREVRCVRIITQDLVRAGVTKGKDGSVVEVPADGERSVKRIRVEEDA